MTPSLGFSPKFKSTRALLNCKLRLSAVALRHRLRLQTAAYGPECFTIRGPRERRAYPYTLQAHYYSRGPMGYGMGKLQVVEHDGNGKLSFEERPFVVMVDRGYVDMGTVDRSTKLSDAAAMNR